MKMQWKKGSQVKASLKDTYAAIMAAKNADGEISIEELINNARPKDAPLHGDFEWSQKAAAHKWRLFEGRRIVGSIEVIPLETEGIPIRAFQSVKVTHVNTENNEVKTKRVFQSIEDIMHDPEARADLMQQAIRDAIRFRQKYAALQEFSKLFQIIDDIADSA